MTTDPRESAAEPAPAPGVAEPTPEIVLRLARRRRLRIVALALTIAALIVLGRVTGLAKQLDVDALARSVRDAGPAGAALFMAAFVLGVLVHIPGTIFVAAGIAVYGRLIGYALSLVAASLAVCASFVVTRAIGGQPLGEVRRPWLRRMFARLDERPLLWVFVLRNFAFVSPPLNTALALSKVRFRDYAIGSSLGLVAPMAFMTYALDYLMPWFSRLAHWIFG